MINTEIRKMQTRKEEKRWQTRTQKNTDSTPTIPETQAIADTTTIQERINTGKHRFQQKTQ